MRQAATRKPKEKLTELLHHITTDVLEASYFMLKQDAAAGVDGVTWDEYGNGLEERLLDLHDRVHSGAYRALPSRRVEIPKSDGGTRPLGIATLEDKIVLTAVAETIIMGTPKMTLRQPSVRSRCARRDPVQSCRSD